MQSEARAWFEHLRDEICAEFETIEEEQDGPMAERAPGRFKRTAWDRPVAEGATGGGGVMSVM